MEPEIMEVLLRKLADNHSQRNIASILNGRELFKENGCKWDQASVSRYMERKGIKPAGVWKGWS